MRKFTIAVSLLLLCVASLSGCAESTSAVFPVTREDGSGTRSAFSELFGLNKDFGGDTISDKCEVTNSTSVMLTSVAGCKGAIGYVSSGIVRGEVKVLKIDGVSPSEATIRRGEYKIVRSFLAVTSEKSALSPVAEDFLAYLTSKEASEVISELGYVPSSDGTSYSSKPVSGKITVAGSTSVAPAVEAVSEVYMLAHPDVKIEIQQTGSSAGLLSLDSGICDIALSSRSLTDGEKSDGFTPLVIAYDGIAVITNPANPVNDISTETVKAIFNGDITDWNDIAGYKTEAE